MGCFYCDEHHEGREAIMYKVGEMEAGVLYLFKDQAHKGRCALALKNHRKELCECGPEELAAFARDLARASGAVKELWGCDKINLGSFGDTNPHLHFHIVPKYEGGFEFGGSFAITNPEPVLLSEGEYQEMIAALHAAGIGVIMDVVYNHMYRYENVLNNTVPDYFFRQNEDGSLSNGSGCGNEFASERPMARKYMIDSLLYWAQEYHIDGFRFDLMGLYDVDTMNAARAALDALPGGRDILMYGEPWQGGGSQLHRYEANKANLSMLNERIGIFCDDTRDAIKGGCFNAREPGYVEGKPGSFWDIGGAVVAWCRSDRLPLHAPSQIVSYVSAHDNFTLWDKLLCVRYERPEFTASDPVALAQNRLAAGIYLTSFGLPFLQAGEEFARTKKGVGNSYRSSPALNRLDWARARQYHALVDYYRGLLALRAAFPRLGTTDRHAPEALQFFSLEQPLVGWTLPAAPGDGAWWRALCVFYNPTDTSRVVPLPAGRWKLLSNGTSSSLWRGESRTYEREALLMPYSATVFGAV